MKLTFKNETFTLKLAQRDIMMPKTFESWTWLGSPSFTYETKNLGAAAAFRHFADHETEKIFKSVFNDYIENPKPPPLRFLDTHQREGVEWILSRKRSYLAHAPGAGKTAQAIVAGDLIPGDGQIVFIVPPSLTLNWAREIEHFSLEFDFKVSIVPSQSIKQSSVDWRSRYIIVPDSMLTKDWVYEKLRSLKIKLLGIDEASRFKEPTAARTIALYGGQHKERAYRGLARRARRVVLLDGSPMPNRPMELWAPTYALDPEAIDCMDMNAFGYRFCGPTTNDRGQVEFKHASHMDELKGRLRKRFMHVVSEDALSHPERRRSMLLMSEDVRAAEHKAWERKHLDEIDFDEMEEGSDQGDLAKFRRELGVRKVPWITRYVRDRMDTKNESILLFVWHREVAESLTNHLAIYKPGLIIGGVKANDRERYIEEFQSGKRRLLILNIQAAGRGHNLQRADRVIFGEFSWTDESNKQCEKRASRRGRDASAFVRCEYVVSPDSMDERMLTSIFTKERRVKRIIG